MNEEQDIETAKLLVSLPEWRWAKEKLESMMEIYKHANLTGTDTAVGREYKRRKDVVANITSWIEYIEGSAEIPSELDKQQNLISRF